jgi:FPC/CPF motif-containing protein YcgG
MWALLRDLAQLDTEPWPATVDTRLDHPAWEFSFAGEPVFVVCNTPAHVLRQSRRASTFTVTFQPRFVFDGILDGAARSERAVAAVRRRLAAYDMVSPSPWLGRYGEVGVREHEQYFLGDDNERPRCPFVSLREDDWQTASKSEAAA